MPPELKVNLARARKQSGRSMNAEILARLALTFDPDPALQLTDIFRPLLDGMSEADRGRFVEHVAGAVDVLAEAGKRKG